ncbi:MAG: type I restriction enzyme HsdR N-terminal domain-containing protein [Prevotellaceae bacterium]|jgi:type I site-specific restriction endonuclease|nr:type I restriction enzyme HsdR N-terminal domain-containing protein [Prevotellaceae bacterium]
MENFIPRVRITNGKQEIYDVVRKKFVALMPEELVRQQLLHYLTAVKKFPSGLLQVEVPVPYLRHTYRADIVAYDRYLKPLLIAECKAPDVKITQEICEQIARYNLVLKVPYLLITNGQQHLFYRFTKEQNNYMLVDEMADYKELVLKSNTHK